MKLCCWRNQQCTKRSHASVLAFLGSLGYCQQASHFHQASVTSSTRGKSKDEHNPIQGWEMIPVLGQWQGFPRADILQNCQKSSSELKKKKKKKSLRRWLNPAPDWCRLIVCNFYFFFSICFRLFTQSIHLFTLLFFHSLHLFICLSMSLLIFHFCFLSLQWSICLALKKSIKNNLIPWSRKFSWSTIEEWLLSA